MPRRQQQQGSLVEGGFSRPVPPGLGIVGIAAPSPRDEASRGRIRRGGARSGVRKGRRRRGRRRRRRRRGRRRRREMRRRRMKRKGWGCPRSASRQRRRGVAAQRRVRGGLCIESGWRDAQLGHQNGRHKL